ncbi:MAG TPA: Uma2 family endonuclease [Pirellulales bacterium]|nr:Uma2 family endonuclease [Pirellulales bacterium]
MSIAERPKKGLRLLVNGERMSQPEFHRRYEACPEDEKWELIGGVVYVASPLKWKHSSFDGEIGYLLESYRRATTGIDVTHNATAILGDESEPQPDLAMRILTDYGGQSRINADDYVEGAPELVVEVAHSRRNLAMHAKRKDYRRSGVVEYLVLLVEERELHWFYFPDDEIRPNREGISKSRVFPGFWIDIDALLRRDSERLLEVLRQGLASRPHASFVKRLQAAHRRRASKG